MIKTALMSAVLGTSLLTPGNTLPEWLNIPEDNSIPPNFTLVEEKEELPIFMMTIELEGNSVELACAPIPYRDTEDYR